MYLYNVAFVFCPAKMSLIARLELKYIASTLAKEQQQRPKMPESLCEVQGLRISEG